MRRELRSRSEARCAQASQGKGHLLPAAGSGSTGDEERVWGQAWRTLPATCLPSPPRQCSLAREAAQRTGGELSPREQPGEPRRCCGMICALNTLPLKTILTAFEGIPRPPMNIWSSMNKRAWREPQSLNIYIYIRHRNAVLTFSC